ncbi:MAG: hypothetical protein MUF21_07985 [Gemmatimonadaceae bacterium]|nr:hypothetical protein [Gemmatimonadaceae bacterium]
MRQSDGTLKLIAYDAIGELVRVGDRDAGPVSEVAAITLSPDRIVTAVRAADGTLKAIAWRDRAVALLRGDTGPGRRWGRVPLLPGGLGPIGGADDGDGPGSGGQPPATGTGSLSSDGPDAPAGAAISPPLIGAAVDAGVNRWGVDPMLTVGHRFVLVSQDHEVAFFDRTGQRLAPKGGEEVQPTSNELFAPFLSDTLEDGTRNDHAINRHIGTGAWGPECPPARGADPCIDEFMDVRVAYDRALRRFIVVARARDNDMKYDGDGIALATDPAVRRFLAIAVSKTDDPRDGFWQYVVAESNYSDFPRVTAQHGLLVIADNSYGTVRRHEGPTPTATIFDLAALARGEAHPASHKLYPDETGGSVRVLMNHGPIPGEWTTLSRPSGDALHLYSFRTLASLVAGTALRHTSVTLPSAFSNTFVTHNVRRGAFLYFASYRKVADVVKNVRPARYAIRVVRVPLALAADGAPTPGTGSGFLDDEFGGRATTEPSSARLSYEVPALAVTRDGHMVVVYGRVPVSGTGATAHEVRYSVWYADSRGLQHSRLLRAGQWLPTARLDSTWTAAVPIPYFGPQKLDHASASVDPVDDETVWMAHAFADVALAADWDATCNGKPKRCERWRSIVIGRVRP